MTLGETRRSCLAMLNGKPCLMTTHTPVMGADRIKTSRKALLGIAKASGYQLLKTV